MVGISAVCAFRAIKNTQKHSLNSTTLNEMSRTRKLGNVRIKVVHITLIFRSCECGLQLHYHVILLPQDTSFYSICITEMYGNKIKIPIEPNSATFSFQRPLFIIELMYFFVYNFYSIQKYRNLLIISFQIHFKLLSMSNFVETNQVSTLE